MIPTNTRSNYNSTYALHKQSYSLFSKDGNLRRRDVNKNNNNYRETEIEGFSKYENDKAMLMNKKRA